MADPTEDADLIITGPAGEVRYLPGSARRSVDKFLESIKTTKLRTLVKLHELWACYVRAGRLQEHHMKKLKGYSELWEFRAHDVRVLCFVESRMCYIAKAFCKDSNETPVRHLQAAEALWRAFQKSRYNGHPRL